eukprot:c25575_g1_i1 orf=594-3800(-)
MALLFLPTPVEMSRDYVGLHAYGGMRQYKKPGQKRCLRSFSGWLCVSYAKKMELNSLSGGVSHRDDKSWLEPFREIKSNWQRFTNLNYWVVRDYYRLVKAVNAFEPVMRRLSNTQLHTKTDEFRERIRQGESLDDIQAETFAVVREAARRTLGMRHFDVQVIGGAVLHDGAIAEMKTGEGKTLVSPLAAYLNALTGGGVHVVTVNDYLAQRDAEWMGQIHRFLGLSVGLVQSGMDPVSKKAAYCCDVTFANNSEIGFDYLRDNICLRKEEQVLRWPKPFNFVIIDEIDSVLIDEGRNPLIISTNSSKDVGRFPVAARVAELLVQNQHYTVDNMDKSVELTEEGIAAAEHALDTDDLWSEKDPWARFIMSALRAKEFYQQDVHYIVKEGVVQIVDEFTGRVVESRRWSEGLHQSVEAKEGVEIREETVVAAQITNQSFYKLYPKLSGMTGTAKTAEREFLRIFQIPVVEVPTNLPSIRQDLPLRVYATREGKWQGARDEVISMYKQGRPVLVGTTSVEQSEYLSDLLQASEIPHNVLNARPKYAAREAEIIAQAGKKWAITIATNMAGRGTDIILGGNPEMLARHILEENLLGMLTTESPDIDKVGASVSHMAFSRINLSPASFAKLGRAKLAAKYVVGRGGEYWNYFQAKSKLGSFLELAVTRSEEELVNLAGSQGAEVITLGPAIAVAYLSVLRDCHTHCHKEGEEVKRLGGLHVCGMTLHESCRIDNQLRGRAGRQGDPGSTRFMISFEDELFQRIGTTQFPLAKWIPRDTAISDSKFMEEQVVNIQRFMENFYSGIRKSLVDYDEVLEAQRVHVYSLRQLFLNGNPVSLRQCLFQYLQDVADEIILPHVDPNKPPKLWKIQRILQEFQHLLDKFLKDGQKRFKLPSEEMVIASMGKVQGMEYTQLDTFSLPGLPPPPYQFEGPMMKAFAVKRWLRLTSDGSVENQKYQKEVNLLQRYFGEILIGIYRQKLFLLDMHPVDIDKAERMLAITALDTYWRKHLVNMSQLCNAVNVRSFGNMNPLEEYKIESLRLFIAMLSSFRHLTVDSLLKPWLVEIDDRRTGNMRA